MPQTNSPHWFPPAHVAPCHIQAQTGVNLGLCPQAPLSPSTSAAIRGVESTAGGSWSQARPHWLEFILGVSLTKAQGTWNREVE